MSPTPPEIAEVDTGYKRDELLDKPGIVGARWWHTSLVAQDKAIRRRQALKSMLVVGGVVGAVTLFGYGIARAASDDPDLDLQTRKSLDMQKAYGWNFGARSEALVFDGKTTAPFVRDELKSLSAVMRPTHFPEFHLSTILEALDARPTSSLTPPSAPVVPDETVAFQVLREVIVPIQTESMKRAYQAGEALARLSKDVLKGTVIAVDLAGPDTVAFAAGAAEVFEPVLLFDNWPHPRGVVASHLVLAALAFYQPRFASARIERAGKSALPLFALDRTRLTAYSDATDRFDNRYLAKLPTLNAIGSKQLDSILYVVPTPRDLPESDDLNDLFTDPSNRNGVFGDSKIRAIAASDFVATGDGPAYYGGSKETDPSIWVNYPFVTYYALPKGAIQMPSTTASYRFTSRLAGSVMKNARIGEVAVLVLVGGGVVAAALDRQGSMNRFSGSWSG